MLTPEREDKVRGFIAPGARYLVEANEVGPMYEAMACVRDLLAEIDRLRAENEALREAGEGLATALRAAALGTNPDTGYVLARWRAVVENSAVSVRHEND